MKKKIKKTEILLWMSGIEDEFILDAAKDAGIFEGSRIKKRKEKSGSFFVSIGAAVGAAAIIAAVLFGGGLFQRKQNEPIKEVEPSQEETIKSNDETDSEINHSTEEEKETDPVTGLRADEYLVLPIADNRQLIVDSQRKIVEEFQTIDRGSLKGLDKQVLPNDSRIIAGIVSNDIFSNGFYYGLYDLKSKRWLIKPEYLSLCEAENGLYAAEVMDENQFWKMIQIIKEDGTVLYQSQPRSTLWDNSYIETDYATEHVLYDLYGNQIFDLEGYTLQAVSGGFAAAKKNSEENNGILIDLKSKTILREWNSGEFYAADFLGRYCVVEESDGGTQHIYDTVSENEIDWQVFCSKNRQAVNMAEEKQNPVLYLIDRKEETGELLVAVSEQFYVDRSLYYGNIDYYICDADWNIKNSYLGLIGGADHYGAQDAPEQPESGWRCRITDLWTGKTEDIDLPQTKENYFAFYCVADSWYCFMDKEGKNVLTFSGKIMESGQLEIEKYQTAIALNYLTEENGNLKYYSLDGEVFCKEEEIEGQNIKSEEILYLSDNEIAVKIEEKIIFFDWNGKELANLEFQKEEEVDSLETEEEKKRGA